VKSHDITDDFVEQHSKQKKTTAKPYTDDDDFVKTRSKKRKRKSVDHQSKEKGKLTGNKFLSQLYCSILWYFIYNIVGF